MKKIIACLLLVFSSAVLYAQQSVMFKSYSDAKEKVSIKYPSTWTKIPYSEAVFKFARPVEERGQRLRENMILVVGPAQDLALIEYLEDARKKYKESIPDFRELKSQFIKINGIDFVRMVYQFPNSGLMIKSVLYLAVHNDKAYSLNFNALNNTFDKYYPAFETMAKSFKIK